MEVKDNTNFSNECSAETLILSLRGCGITILLAQAIKTFQKNEPDYKTTLNNIKKQRLEELLNSIKQD